MARRKKKPAEQIFLYEQKKELIKETMLYQRRVFIEALRRGESWIAAMSSAGIHDLAIAQAIYNKNSTPVTRRVLVDPEKVR